MTAPAKRCEAGVWPLEQPMKRKPSQQQVQCKRMATGEYKLGDGRTVGACSQQGLSLMSVFTDEYREDQSNDH